MKRKDALKILFALALLGLGSCNNEPEDLLFEDFESGNGAEILHARRGSIQRDIKSV